MRHDPLVDEARQAGQKYIDSFKGDWKAVIADLARRAQQAGRHVATPPPKRVERVPQGPQKKAG